MAKKILFVCYGGGHAHMVYPVINELKKSSQFLNQDISIEVLGLTGGGPILKAQGVESKGYAHFLNPETDKDAMAWGEELAKEHHSDSIGITREESIAYLGLNYKDLVERFGESEAAESLRVKGRHAFYPLTIMERIFDSIKPDFVVATNSPKSEAASIETANARGIESMIMTDLFSGMAGYVMNARNTTFLNEYAKDKLIEDGMLNPNAGEFHYTGNPSFDRLLALPKTPDMGWAEERFPGLNTEHYVLHADMPAYWDPKTNGAYFKTKEETLEEMDEVYKAAVHNKATYLVRPHPTQGSELCKEWLKGKENAYLAADFDLHQLIRNVSMLVVRTTTVGLEAAYLQKKVLQLDSDYHSDLPLAKMGIAWGVNSYSELAQRVGEVLEDSEQHERIKKQIVKVLPAEPAASQIANIVLGKLG